MRFSGYRMKLNWPTLWIFAFSAISANFHLLRAEEPMSETEAKDFFIQKVHPLLQTKCLGCHGDDEKNIEADLDMRTREGLLHGGESGEPSLIPGQPEKSPMYRAILRQDKKFKMPPKDRNALSKDEIKIF